MIKKKKKCQMRCQRDLWVLPRNLCTIFNVLPGCKDEEIQKSQDCAFLKHLVFVKNKMWKEVFTYHEKYT